MSGEEFLTQGCELLTRHVALCEQLARHAEDRLSSSEIFVIEFEREQATAALNALIADYFAAA